MLKLDRKQQKLISALVENCRSSDRELAKKILSSREVVAYRIKNLEKEGIIKGYTADINFNKLGFIPYSVCVKLQNLPQEKEKNIIDKIVSNKKFIFLQKTLSKYDIIGTILVKSAKELGEEIGKLRQFVGKNLKYMDIDAILGDYDFLGSFFNSKSENSMEINFFDNTQSKLGDEDKKIIDALTTNSRMTAVALSKKLKISVFSIARKIKKMQEEKIILAFRPIIDMEKLGHHRYTILLNMFNEENERKLVEFCRRHKSIWDIGKFTGNYNYAVEIYAENNEEFRKTAAELIGRFSDDIIDYETLIILEELKRKYFYI